VLRRCLFLEAGMQMIDAMRMRLARGKHEHGRRRTIDIMIDAWPWKSSALSPGRFASGRGALQPWRSTCVVCCVVGRATASAATVFQTARLCRDHHLHKLCMMSRTCRRGQEEPEPTYAGIEERRQMPAERVAKGPQTSVIASRNDHMKANAHERSWVGKGNTSAWEMQRHRIRLVCVAERRRRRSSEGTWTSGSRVV
jgi:hypothetical protein